MAFLKSDLMMPMEKRFARLAVLLFLLASLAPARAVQSAWVHYDATHSLVYSNDDVGNHIPDFSFAGFGGGGVALPTNATVKMTLSAIVGDNTTQIQNALNSVGNLTPDANGFRGVVLLNPGSYEMDGTLSMSKSGVILRGAGSSPTGTVLHFIGAARQTFSLQGSGSVSQTGTTYNITNVYVPLGATNFTVTDGSTFAPGNLIIVRRPVTQVWINAIGMNATNINWTPGSGLGFERTVTAVSGNQLTIDIPLCNPIEQQWCTGYVYHVTESGRITNAAIESLRLRSDFSDASTNWGNSRALNFDNCKNCWLKNIFVDNYYNGINSGGGAKWCTVQDCYFVSNTIPTTAAGAAAFGGSGQMLLWQRCGCSNSVTYHVLVTQAAVPGPNVFLNFGSFGSGYDCGPHQRWAAGVLIDNNTAQSPPGVNVGIKLQNRGSDGSGQGYGAGYSIIYNGNSQGIINEIPQVAHHYNWAIGGANTSTFQHHSDDGVFDATNGLVNPLSLYLEQLRERLGGAAVENIGYTLFSLSPTPLTQSIGPGAAANFTVNVGDPSSMSNVVSLAVGTLPANVSATLNTNSVTGAGTATLSVFASNSIAPGIYTLTINGTNAGVGHSTQVNLIIGSISLSASPGSQTILPGGNTSFTVNVTTNNNFSGSINFGISGLPAGVTEGFSPGALAGNGSSALSLTTTSNAPSGSYTLVITATNGVSVASTTVGLNLSIPVANPGTLFWTGASGTDINWSNPFNWTNMSAGGYGPPGANNSVIFTNFATVTQSALTSPGSGVVVPGNINDFANTSFSVPSLTSMNNSANTSPMYHNISIANGSLLNAGSNLQVGGDTAFDFGANNVVNLTISGAGAGATANGTLIVNETSASTGVHNAMLDMSGLDNFTLGGGNIKVGVEGSGNAHRATGLLYLAKTNNLTINNNGNVAFYVGHNKSTAPSASPALYLGISNAVFMANSTGLMIGRADTPGSLLAFNPAFAGQNPTAYFRGASATSRIATWNVGDNSANNNNSANPTSGTNDFTAGTIDALVSVMTLGVSCPSGASASGNGTGTFSFAAGTLDVNTLILGSDTGNTGTSAGIGVMNVDGGLLNVNTSLQLGAFVAGSGGLPQGTLNINGGTVQSPVITSSGISTINLNSGTLNSPIITNISTINIGANAAGGTALMQNAVTVSSANNIGIAANGIVAGNTAFTTPALVINGTVSPGSSGIGAITNNGDIILGAGGSFELAVQGVTGNPGVAGDFVQASGRLNIQSTAANPFIISLESFANGAPGMLDGFSYTTNFDWVIASAAGGITNFGAAGFTVDTTFFQNDLAGGYFYVRTNANSLALSFTNNHPPAAATYTTYSTGSVTAIPIANLLPYWSDPDGDPVELDSLNPTSTNGASVGMDGSFIYYTNNANVADEILYTVQDVRTNPPAVYQPDDTVLTAPGVIMILPPPMVTQVTFSGTNLVSGGTGGMPGSNYVVLTSTNLTLPLPVWKRTTTNVFDGSGGFNFTNPAGAGLPQSFYTIQVQ